MSSEKDRKEKFRKVNVNKLIYLLKYKEKTAEVVGQDQQCDDIFIPKSIEYDGEEFIITSINENCFSHSSLKTLHFASDSELQTISNNAFQYSTIKSLSIPSSLTDLKGGWAVQAPDLTEITIDPNNQFFKIYDEKLIIGKSDPKSDIFDVIVYAFKSIKTVTIPSNIRKIASFAFSESMIENLTIPPHITQICEYAFSLCESLRSIEFSPDSELRVIEKGAFNESSIEHITIPHHITNIYSYTFSYCQNLKSVKMQQNSELRAIESYAFLNSSIERLTIPSNCSELGEMWCQYTKNLNQVSVMEGNKHFMNFDGKMIIGKSDLTSNEFDDLLFVARDATTVTLPSFIKRICTYSFHKSLIEKVIIPPHVKIICKMAFAECSNLRSIEFHPDSELQTIEMDAFYLSNIKSITIPSSVSDLQDEWFYGARFNIVKVDENNKNYLNIEDKMLVGKSDINSDIFDVLHFVNREIETVTIPPFIKYIAPYAFSGSKITSITIPHQITQISANAFTYCYNLKHVDFEPNSQLQIIGEKAFRLCAVESLVIPSHVSVIEKNVFEMSFALKIIEFEENSEFILKGKRDFNDFENGILMFQPLIDE